MSLLKMAVVFIFRLLITPSFTYNLPISHYNDCASPAAWLASFITPIIFYPVRCPQYNSLTGFRCCVVHLNSLITSGWLYLFVRPLFNATLGSSLSSVIMSSVCFFFVNLRLPLTTDLLKAHLTEDTWLWLKKRYDWSFADLYSFFLNIYLIYPLF